MTNLPTDMRLDSRREPHRRHGPVQTKALIEGVIMLEFATMLMLAASDELRLQIWYSGADGYTAQNITALWGYRSADAFSARPCRLVSTQE